MAIITLNNNSLSSVTSLPAAIATGKVLQVVTNSSTTSNSTTSTSMVELINASITPSSASNKILIFAQVNIEITANTNAFVATAIFRGTTSGTEINNLNAGHSVNQQLTTIVTHSHIDSPSTTSSQQYTLAFRRSSSNTTSIATQTGNNYNITLMEIEA